MKSPFPGMDPYFEDPAFWEGFHDVFITEFMYAIESSLPEGYISDVKERSKTISIEDEAAAIYIPDIAVAREKMRSRRRRRSTDESAGVAVAAPVVIPALDEGIEIEENYIEIFKLPDRELVTAIELLSPWNKHGAGVAEYRGKRQSLVNHGVHVVEIDLLRRGRRTELAEPLPPGDYYTLVFRADRRPDVEVRAWGLRDPLPGIAIPLRKPDVDLKLDLAAIVATVYERGRYDRKLRYSLPVPAPASEPDVKWVTQRLRDAQLRHA